MRVGAPRSDIAGWTVSVCANIGWQWAFEGRSWTGDMGDSGTVSAGVCIIHRDRGQIGACT